MISFSRKKNCKTSEELSSLNNEDSQRNKNNDIPVDEVQNNESFPKVDGALESSHNAKSDGNKLIPLFSREEIANKFLDVVFYRKNYPDLAELTDVELIKHFAEHGFYEFRDPSILLRHSDFAEMNIGLCDWLVEPEFSSLPSSLWRVAVEKAGLSYDIDALKVVTKILNIWKVSGLYETDLLFLIFAHSRELALAVDGSLPSYFDWGKGQYSSDVDRLHGWLAEFADNGTSFSTFFDESFYSAKYKDLEGVNYFYHFIAHGCDEGRLPNALFCDYQYHNSMLKGFSGFFNSEGVIPEYATGANVFLQRVCGKESLCEFQASFGRLASVINGKFHSYSELSIFMNLFNAGYLRALTGRSAAEGFKTLEWWLLEGRAVPFSPLFCRPTEGYEVVDWLDEYKSWVGDSSRINEVPCYLYNEEFYRLRNLDLASVNGPAFLHFVNHGQFENRQAHPLFDLAWIGHYNDTCGMTALDYYFYCESVGQPIKPAPAIMPINGGLAFADEQWLIGGIQSIAEYFYENGVFDLSSGTELSRVISAASEIDPQIKKYDPMRTYSVMPFNSDAWTGMRKLADIVGRRDILIFRDGINFGGADVVLKHCYQTMSETGLSIGVVVMGDVDYQVVDAHGISRDDVVDLSSIEEGNRNFKPHLVYDIIIGSQCKRIFNLNCGAAWSAIEDYGKIIHKKAKISAFMFCDDRDLYGNIEGYPSRYFFSTARHLDSIFVDSEALKVELLKRSAGSNNLAKKIIVLHSPLTNSMASTVTYVENLPEGRSISIAWAGRFDEQKCPDLLREIAIMLPEVKFHVWGKAVLSKKNYNLSSVPNIILEGLYSVVDEITAKECDLYLYTSRWDGIPTILLRIQEQGIPIVASDVGGVSEAIPDVGLVKGHSAGEYVDRIRYFIDNLSDISEVFDAYKKENLTERTQENFTGIILESNNGN